MRTSRVFVVFVVGVVLLAAQVSWAQVFYATGSQIKTTALTGGASTPIWSTTTSDLVYDRIGSRFFWGQGTALTTGAASGSGSASTVVNNGVAPNMIAYDPANQVVYWKDTLGSNVYRVPASGGSAALFVASGTARDIAIDYRPGRRYLYYPLGGVIHRVPLDGGAGSTLPSYTDVDFDVLSVAVDTCGNYLFLLGSTTPHPGTPEPQIRRIDLANGANLATIRAGFASVGSLASPRPFKIAVDSHDRKVFWSTENGSSSVPEVRSADLTSSSNATIVSDSSPGVSIVGLDLDFTESCPDAPALGPLGLALLAALLLVAASVALIRQRRTNAPSHLA